MSKSKVIGTRFNEPLLTKIQQHELSNSELIRTVVERYFLNDGKNNTLYNDFATDNNNVYSQDLISTLQTQVLDLKRDKDFLQQQNNALLLTSLPLLSRIKIKLLSR
jgi:hypothetical protein